jgi:cold shock CspA family protein
MSDLQRMNGVVRTVVSDRGFFFIRAENGVDYFAHMEDLVDAGNVRVEINTRLSFTATQTGKGPRARQVEAFSAAE